MPGREPMNPRGRQFGLAGRLDSWVRREAFADSEAAVLRRCYAGREPRTFSRYGIRQWAAPLPRTRIVIKDPFAVLSLAAVHRATDAIPVLLYRHPAAVLSSYRRMGWTADTEEFTALGAPPPDGDDDLAAMVAMWSWCHRVALDDLATVPGAVIVSHRALTAGGPEGQAALARELGLAAPAVESHADASRERREGVLHDFSRSTAAVESGWRKDVGDDEVATIEAAVADIWRELEARQFAVPAVAGGGDPDQIRKVDPT